MVGNAIFVFDMFLQGIGWEDLKVLFFPTDISFQDYIFSLIVATLLLPHPQSTKTNNKENGWGHTSENVWEQVSR